MAAKRLLRGGEGAQETMIYYNDNHRPVVSWLRDLINRGMLANGLVDNRRIEDVRPNDLAGYRRCHFFAGIGGWELALQMAKWPDDAEIWTGSCPCQPFSQMGKMRAAFDERHVWPEFYRLIKECKPAVVVGEQVASKLGRDWLSGVFADLEAVGYAVAGADLCAAGVGAPHIRQRLYWVANADGREAEYYRARQQDNQYGLPVIRRPGAWDDYRLVPSAVGETPPQQHRIKPGISAVVNGFPGWLALNQGYGNAIVPPVAALFIRAAMEAMAENQEGHRPHG